MSVVPQGNSQDTQDFTSDSTQEKIARIVKALKIDCHERVPSPVRTRGDGMEKPEPKTENVLRNTLFDKLIYRPEEHKSSYTSPPSDIGVEKISLTPHNICKPKKEKIFIGSLKGREPKFVPYEPYKGAVKPIVPPEKKRVKKTCGGVKVRSRKSSLLSNHCNEPSQLSSKSRVTEEDNQVENESILEGSLLSEGVCNDVWEEERKKMNDQITQLKDERDQLEAQLKFQAQVNGELKTLLVAAVGEDLESRVHHLTEDKAHLSRALLSSARRLSTHREQTEWLASQCEVWRSKFLASSIMVEELARWKAAFSQRASDLQEALNRLLEERASIKEGLFKTYRTLLVLRENLDPAWAGIEGTGCSRGHAEKYGHTGRSGCSLNLQELSVVLSRIGNGLTERLLGSSAPDTKKFGTKDTVGEVEALTPAELAAKKLASNSLLFSSCIPDAACSAVVSGASIALSRGIPLPPDTTPMHCCPHCSGHLETL
ncbi:golgin-45 isoform X1 [Hetaerina americana]|uniref:golgin-45 isoform X1 n=1 Tax=Hetaerina americana TaxID=62018 RepID=UPI003A7F31D2